MEAAEGIRGEARRSQRRGRPSPSQGGGGGGGGGWAVAGVGGWELGQGYLPHTYWRGRGAINKPRVAVIPPPQLPGKACSRGLAGPGAPRQPSPPMVRSHTSPPRKTSKQTNGNNNKKKKIKFNISLACLLFKHAHIVFSIY